MNNNVLEFKTSQTAVFKETMKKLEYVNSICSMIATPDGNDKSGIGITMISPFPSLMLYTCLKSSSFDSFECKEKRLEIKFDLCKFNKKIEKFNNEYPIVIYLKHDNRNKIYAKSIDPSHEKIIEIKCEDYGVTSIEIPTLKFVVNIEIDTIKIKKIIEKLQGDYIRFSTVGNEVAIGKFEGDDSCIYDPNFINDKEKSIAFLEETKNIYSSDDFLFMGEWHTLSEKVNIFVKDDFAMLSQLETVFGQINIFITPGMQTGNYAYLSQKYGHLISKLV